VLKSSLDTAPGQSRKNGGPLGEIFGNYQLVRGVFMKSCINCHFLMKDSGITLSDNLRDLINQKSSNWSENIQQMMCHYKLFNNKKYLTGIEDSDDFYNKIVKINRNKCGHYFKFIPDANIEGVKSMQNILIDKNRWKVSFIFSIIALIISIVFNIIQLFL